MRSLGYALLTLLTLGIFSPSARASSIEQVTVERMLRESSLIFEGVVVEHEPGILTPAGDIRTCVVFDVLEVLKGSTTEKQIRLCFSGGTVADLTLIVADSVIPETGEWGVYFVESTETPLVNPLFGWAQGHFLIESPIPGNGVADKRSLTVPRVFTQRRHPVLDLGSGPSDPAFGLSAGVADGVEEGSPESTGDALAPGEFKLEIRRLLGEL